MPNASIKPAEPDLLKRGLRAPISLICEVRQGTRVWRVVRLDNLSSQGFRLAWSPDINADMPLRIKIPGIQLLTAHIRWRNGASIGCEFAEPLHVAVFEHLVQKAKF